MVFGYRIQSSIREDGLCRENGFWEHRKLRKKDEIFNINTEFTIYPEFVSTLKSIAKSH